MRIMSIISGITIGQYIPGSSVIHRLDPRLKILALLIYVATVFSVQTFYGFAVLVGFSLVLLFLSRLPGVYFIRGLKPVAILLSFTILLHFFLTKGGEVLLQLGPLTVETVGVSTGLFMSSRLILMVLTTYLLTLTTTPLALTDGIEYLLRPLERLGVPAHEIAMMMTIALRFIPTLMEETEKIMKAQMSRGADFTSGGFIRRARSLVPLLAPLFISAFRRADELAMAMEARCYRGGKNRTRMKEMTITVLDYYALVISLSFLLFINLMGI